MNTKTMKRDELTALVAKHYEISEQEITDKTDDELLFLVNQLQLTAAAPSKGKKAAVADAIARPEVEQRTRIVIHEQDGPDGHDDVTIGVNGRVAQIKREMEVELTDAQIHVLDNAVYLRFEPLRDKPGEYIERSVKRFNYSVLGPAKLAA